MNDASGSAACKSCAAMDAWVFLASPSAQDENGASTACMCNAGFTAPMNGTKPMDCRWKQCAVARGEVPNTPFCSNALFINLVSPPSFRSWQGSSSLGSIPLPAYNPLGGPQSKGHVSFDRAQAQYLDAGPRTLNIATNGGLTIVVVVRFTGTVGSWEHIIDLGSGSPFNNVPNNIHFGRFDLANLAVLEIFNGANQALYVELHEWPFDQGSWLTVVVSYRASTREVTVQVNDKFTAVPAPEALIDRAVSETYIGKSHYRGDAYFNGDMAGIFVVDEYLSAETASAIADDMVQGVDLFNSELCKTGPCVQCEAGTYKRTVGWSSVLTLRPRPLCAIVDSQTDRQTRCTV